MNIAVIGAGYVGLVTGACFAELGNHVTCIDINKEKIAKLNQAELPIFEPGLQQLVKTNMQEDRLTFVHSFEELNQHPEVIFIAVGTPSHSDGSADIQYVLDAARAIGGYITSYCVIVDKSTVPVGMGDEVTRIIQNELTKRKIMLTFDVVSNPEFLREGAAITDFMQPDRVIVGLESDLSKAKNIMLDLYLPILRNKERIYFMSVKDAEMTKYAANAMLATRISFMNEMAVLCERMNVDIENVRIGIGSDVRIGSAFLNSGCGYGGSCFPKDVRALIKMAEQHEVSPFMLQAAEKRNFLQKKLLADKVFARFGENLSGMTFAIWGLSFKPGTDDMREASSLVLIEELLLHGASIQAYDPVAMPKASQLIPDSWFADKKILMAEHQYDALEKADALILVTEWKPFCYPDTHLMKKLMCQPVIFDGRNQYDPKHMHEAGFEYYGIGRGAIVTEMQDLLA